MIYCITVTNDDSLENIRHVFLHNVKYGKWQIGINNIIFKSKTDTIKNVAVKVVSNIVSIEKILPNHRGTEYHPMCLMQCVVVRKNKNYVYFADNPNFIWNEITNPEKELAFKLLDPFTDEPLAYNTFDVSIQVHLQRLK